MSMNANNKVVCNATPWSPSQI